MLSLIEQIKHGQVWDFHGGIHPPENKKQSNHSAILPVAMPETLVLPLKQHIGSKGKLLVKVGDQVLAGQPLTETDMQQCVPIHAPTSGKVIAIEDRTIAHPSGLSDQCVVIAPDGKDTWGPKPHLRQYREQAPEQLINHIRAMGIAGMGGAGFPTARKLQSGVARTEILIINAAECEPYITADDRLMQDCANEIITGTQILMHIVKPKLAVIGIEDNKPEAIAALKAAAAQAEQEILIQVVPTKYPSGGEKQLIKLITGKEVPAKAFPASIGVLMQNIGTTYAIKRAVIDGEPLIQRVVTLTGKTLQTQQNRWALLGTPIAFLLAQHGYKQDKKLPRVIIGGPMMGFTAPHDEVPVTKTTNCILVPTRREIAPAQQEMACIRCSACADACPVNLLPQQLQWYAKDQDYDKCQDYDLFDCIECGACAYVCPSEIPLVQYYRQAKAEIREIEAEKEAAERARQRFEAKKARMEREKQEREERHRQAAERRKQAAQQNAGNNDALAAAVERVKAKKAAQQNSDVKPAVAAAIARAKAKQAEAAKAGQETPDNSEMMKLREARKQQARERKAAKVAATSVEADQSSEKKDAVAAAIARAKARKAAEQSDAPAKPAPATSDSTDADDKKPAVTAAVARAKARKAAEQSDAPAKPAPATSDSTDADDKKAAVTAAVARAKARKAAEQSDTPAKPASATSDSTDASDKKAAVAAAVARAKARKAAEQSDAPAKPASATSDSTDASDKKAAVAAAVARAKARKAAEQSDAPAKPASATSDSTDADGKKAAVAAAVARAKARKAAQQESTDSEVSHQAPTPSADPQNDKKAAVAAAVARAKARKAAQQTSEDKE
ncbi:electron transport complex subunit RsxC [Salinivibrio proteolyticus]|uniref:Ion-translocating oxidoreductase complex subunit C n=1 Tax=Salinivibrio proteolyticus TaxID=334715 RepID=A0ABY7LAE8_9GAMM|nr:electron transport complex subunit RsxC [Salinivibrio proteolyticus]WBA14053.1 electron transport complex subunit RsxC [Salinivibrio proteolyticus]